VWENWLPQLQKRGTDIRRKKEIKTEKKEQPNLPFF
jgi:hypothetical protein